MQRDRTGANASSSDPPPRLARFGLSTWGGPARSGRAGRHAVDLLGRVPRRRRDVLPWEVGIVRDDLVSRGAGTEQVREVAHSHTRISSISNAGSAAADLWIDAPPTLRRFGRVRPCEDAPPADHPSLRAARADPLARLTPTCDP